MSEPVTSERTASEVLHQTFEWLAEKPSLARTVGAVRRIEELHERTPGLFDELSVLTIRNFTLEPIEPLLKLAGYRAGLRLSVAFSGYDTQLGDVADLLASRPDVVILANRLEEMAPLLSRDFLHSTGRPAEIAAAVVAQQVATVRAVRAASEAVVLVHNFVAPVALAGGMADTQDPGGQLNLIRSMNVDLAEQLRAIDGAYLLDVDHLFAMVGYRNAHDERGARLSDAPLSQAALHVLADAHVRHIQARRGPAIKCLVVDCDNTLWGGVIGEDGITGIALGESGPGRIYADFQQRLLDLRRRGIVLAICSKNNESDVLEVLRKHPDCVLGEDDFATMRINWDDKPDNVAAIAAELNLGLAHLAFIDDDPLQCDWVGKRFPEVRVVQWTETLAGGQGLDDLALFDSLVTTDEDRIRTDLYRAEARRSASRSEVQSPEQYLSSLELVASIGPASAAHLPRLAQLTQRTNQFNLTTRRYDVADLEPLAQRDDVALLWLELQDRFGAYGLVGCGMVRVEGPDALIDTFLLSCRVLGRHVEAALANRLAQAARQRGAHRLIGDYLPTPRNEQVADLYSRLGFAGPEPQPEGQRWHWDLAAGDPAAPDWIKINDMKDAVA